MNSYNKLLRKLLKNNNKKFNINIKNNTNNTNIIQIQIGHHIENKKTYNHNYCLLFNMNINNKILYDVHLSKCLLLSGTKILNILEKIAKKFRLNEIHLEDASYINIISSTNKEYNLSLKNIYILSDGISWYNKFGYISSNFEEEIIHNQKIMEMKLSDYMSLILETNVNYLEEKISRSYNLIKNQFNINNLNSRLIIMIKKNIKKIIIEKYGRNINITDDIVYEAIKIYYKYDKEIVDIIETNEKFKEYLINIRTLNLINYINDMSKISDIIKNFRKRSKNKNIKLDNSELEFIKYILVSSDKILNYDNNLIKIINYTIWNCCINGLSMYC